MRPLNFFTPSPEFVARMATKCAGRIVIDAGCGFGNTTAALLAGGVAAVGVDLQEDKVLAGMHAYPEATGKLLVGDVKEVIYISKPGSEEVDLEGLCYKRLFSDWKPFREDVLVVARALEAAGVGRVVEVPAAEP